MSAWTDLETKKSMNFFVTMTKSNTSITPEEVFQQHKAATGSSRDSKAVRNKIELTIRDLRSKRSTEYDEETLVKILNLLGRKRNLADPTQKPARSSRTNQEELSREELLESLIQFMFEGYKKYRGCFDLRSVPGEWLKCNPSDKSEDDLYAILEGYMFEKFQTNKNISDPDVAKTLHRFKIPVHPDFLRKLLKRATFQMDGDNILTYYKIGNNGSGLKKEELPLLGIKPSQGGNDIASNSATPTPIRAGSDMNEDITEAMDYGEGTSQDYSRKRKNQMPECSNRSKREMTSDTGIENADISFSEQPIDQQQIDMDPIDTPRTIIHDVSSPRNTSVLRDVVAPVIREPKNEISDVDTAPAETILAKQALGYLQEALEDLDSELLNEVSVSIQNSLDDVDPSMSISIKKLGWALVEVLDMVVKNSSINNNNGDSVRLLEVIRTFLSLFLNIESPIIEPFKTEVLDALDQFQSKSLFVPIPTVIKVFETLLVFCQYPV